VPQQGVTHNQRGEPTALVVDLDNKVEQRVLKTNRAVGDKWLVADGLKEGDKVIVEGIQKARPGALVHASEFTSESSAPAAVKQN
jgi:membrane fusion protein, multidrug efflux system